MKDYEPKEELVRPTKAWTSNGQKEGDPVAPKTFQEMHQAPDRTSEGVKNLLNSLGKRYGLAEQPIEIPFEPNASDDKAVIGSSRFAPTPIQRQEVAERAGRDTSPLGQALDRFFLGTSQGKKTKRRATS